MNIDSIQPNRIEGMSPSGLDRPMLSTKAKGGELQPHPEVRSPAVGDTAAVRETDKALRELGQAVERFNVSLKFTRDEDTGTIVVEMIDQTSGETLLQFPTEARLQVAATLTKLQGKIFNVQA